MVKAKPGASSASGAIDCQQVPPPVTSAPAASLFVVPLSPALAAPATSVPVLRLDASPKPDDEASNFVDVDSLFDDGEDLDATLLIAQLDKLSSASSGGENGNQSITASDSTSECDSTFEVRSLLKSDKDDSSMTVDNDASGFRAPPLFSKATRSSSHRSPSPAFASKNAGKFSRSGSFSRRN